MLAIGTGLQDKDVLHWWRPTQAVPLAEEQAWAPWALALELRDNDVAVEQGNSASELEAPDSDPSLRSPALQQHLLPRGSKLPACSAENETPVNHQLCIWYCNACIFPVQGLQDCKGIMEVLSVLHNVALKRGV